MSIASRTTFTTIFVVALFTTISGATARAQGTPIPVSDVAPFTFDTPYAPAPEQCTTAPASTDEVSALLATPVPAVEIPTTDHGIVALPPGVPADDAVATEVSAVLTQLWACNNASNKAAVLTLFTPAAIQQSFGDTTGASYDLADVRADVAAALTPGDPRPPDELASIDAVVSILQQENGEFGVLVLNTDPRVADGDQVLDYFAFATDGNALLVSNVILDPFDLTPDYGFEKSA